ALVAAQQQVLRLSLQDEDDALDERLPLALVLDVVPACPQARDRQRPSIGHGSVLLRRHGVGRTVELRHDLLPQLWAVDAEQREALDRDERDSHRRTDLAAA